MGNIKREFSNIICLKLFLIEFVGRPSLTATGSARGQQMANGVEVSLSLINVIVL